MRDPKSFIEFALDNVQFARESIRNGLARVSHSGLVFKGCPGSANMVKGEIIIAHNNFHGNNFHQQVVSF